MYDNQSLSLYVIYYLFLSHSELLLLHPSAGSDDHSRALPWDSLLEKFGSNRTHRLRPHAYGPTPTPTSGRTRGDASATIKGHRTRESTGHKVSGISAISSSSNNSQSSMKKNKSTTQRNHAPPFSQALELLQDDVYTLARQIGLTPAQLFPASHMLHNLYMIRLRCEELLQPTSPPTETGTSPTDLDPTLLSDIQWAHDLLDSPPLAARLQRASFLTLSSQPAAEAAVARRYHTLRTLQLLA